jgi:hypothetical protein
MGGERELGFLVTGKITGENKALPFPQTFKTSVL